MHLTFTITVSPVGDDWYAAVTVHKKDGPLQVSGRGASSGEALKNAFDGARDPEVQEVIAGVRAAFQG